MLRRRRESIRSWHSRSTPPLVIVFFERDVHLGGRVGCAGRRGRDADERQRSDAGRGRTVRGREEARRSRCRFLERGVRQGRRRQAESWSTAGTRCPMSISAYTPAGAEQFVAREQRAARRASSPASSMASAAEPRACPTIVRATRRLDSEQAVTCGPSVSRGCRQRTAAANGGGPRSSTPRGVRSGRLEAWMSSRSVVSSVAGSLAPR